MKAKSIQRPLLPATDVTKICSWQFWTEFFCNYVHSHILCYTRVQLACLQRYGFLELENFRVKGRLKSGFSFVVQHLLWQVSLVWQMQSEKPTEPVKSTNQANTKRSFWLWVWCMLLHFDNLIWMKCRVMALKWGVPEIGAPPTALSYVKHWQIFFLSFHSFFLVFLLDTLWVSQGKKEKRWGIFTLFQPLAFQNAPLFVENR
jgi:hypothetical protein